MPPDSTASLAPGSRSLVRDEEWLVRRVDRTQSGAQLLTVTGLSSLVRNREAKFIDSIGLFAQLYDDADTPPSEARLPALHSRQLVEVLRKFASYPRRLAGLGDNYLTLEADTWYGQRGRTSSRIAKASRRRPTPHRMERDKDPAKRHRHPHRHRHHPPHRPH